MSRSVIVLERSVEVVEGGMLDIGILLQMTLANCGRKAGRYQISLGHVTNHRRLL